MLNDDAVYLDDPSGKNYSLRYGVSADFRGIGREDYIASFGGDATLFYFKNDSPFSLTQFANAMVNDTLYTRWENPEVTGPSGDWYWRLFAVKAFPRSKADRSLDLLGFTQRKDDPDGNSSANFFRGGANFGSHRLTAKDTTFCIRSPQYYDPSWNMNFGGVCTDFGDMTGTGNRVIGMGGGEPGYSHNFFYVVGNAIDPRVDMYFGESQGGGFGDSITVDPDLLEDAIGSNFTYRTDGGSQTNVGTIQVLHGSSKIPVRLNPRFAVVPPSVQSGDSLRIAPNPCSTHTVVTWESSCSGSVGLQLYDVMGRQVFQERRPTTGALESFSLDLPKLPNGEYFLVLLQEPCVQHGRLLIQQ